ncbi:MAG: hypothetical protein NUV68_04545 [Caldiserica bacterium]|jgi:hypothetical protein|nr:hypothetical protein [Caldisericota bacterium]MDH7563249.1 hypothetical protein [Caldisericota bacterium]
MDLALLIVQIISTIVLTGYAITTGFMAKQAWVSAKASEKMAEEMKAQRIQEGRPYIVAYFDLSFQDQGFYFVIRNLGKSLATDISISIDPPLYSKAFPDLDISVWLAKGISSLATGQEIRTFFDTFWTRFSDESLPNSFTLEIRYRGSLIGEVTEKQTLDLSVYRPLVYSKKADMNDLVKEVKEIPLALKRLEEHLAHNSK